MAQAALNTAYPPFCARQGETAFEAREAKELQVSIIFWSVCFTEYGPHAPVEVRG